MTLDASPTLQTYWDTLSRHYGEVAASILVALSLALIYSFETKPVYRATARLEIEAETPQVQPLNNSPSYQYGAPDESYLATQVNVLRSDNLALRTIQQLGLSSNPEIAAELAKTGSPDSNPRARQDLLVKQFRHHLMVNLLHNTRMLEVNFESTDPELAARVANTLVDNYLEYYFHKKYDATRQASGWMENQLDDLKAKVEESQQALVDYERQNAIVNINDKQSVTEQRVADLSRDLTSAQSDRTQKESLYALMKSNESQAVLLVQNDLLQRLEEKYADLKAQYVDALGQFGPNYPKATRLRDQVTEIQSLIDRERKRIVTRIGNDYLAALGREKLAAASLAKEKGEVGKLNQLLIQHNILKHDFETNQQLYESLLQRLKNATVSAGLTATNIHIVDSALPPGAPVRPRKLLNLSLGLTIGLLLGVTIAFIREGLDYSIKSAEDVERLIDAPALAAIPDAGSARLRRYSLSKRTKPAKDQKSGTALAVFLDPGSPLAESYRVLRTSLLLSTAPRPPQVLLVTSSQPNEGKTCTSLNLALALAQRGGRVLVVDGDLRKQGIAGALGIENERGLSEVLTGAVPLDEALRVIEPLSDLWVLPSGSRPPNPAELISSPTMERIMAALRERFDHIVIDSPPLLCVTDPTILSTLVDGAVLVVESGSTSCVALTRAFGTLKGAGGRVLGVVVNKVNLRRDGHYYVSYYDGYAYAAKSETSAAPARLPSDG